MSAKQSSAFDKLFTRNVPHILEMIFFSLDYESFKRCEKVCSAWRELLKSEPLHTKATSVFFYEIAQENYNLSATVEEKEHDKMQLSRCTLEGNVEEVGQLLSKGVNPNCGCYNPNVLVRIGCGCRQETPPLCLAAMNGHTDMVKILLESGGDPNTVDPYGQTPLHLAVRKRSTEVAKILTNTQTDLNAPDKWGDSPLYWAARSNHLEMVKLLLDAGAKRIQNDRGRTPLHWAAFWGNTDLVKLLLKEGADPNAANILQDTPLSMAQEEGHEDVVKLLRNTG